MTDTILNLTVFAFIGFLIYLYLREEGPGEDPDRGQEND